jgi:hypothetical protein
MVDGGDGWTMGERIGWMLDAGAGWTRVCGA